MGSHCMHDRFGSMKYVEQLYLVALYIFDFTGPVFVCKLASTGLVACSLLVLTDSNQYLVCYPSFDLVLYILQFIWLTAIDRNCRRRTGIVCKCNCASSRNTALLESAVGTDTKVFPLVYSYNVNDFPHRTTRHNILSQISTIGFKTVLTLNIRPTTLPCTAAITFLMQKCPSHDDETSTQP